MKVTRWPLLGAAVLIAPISLAQNTIQSNNQPDYEYQGKLYIQAKKALNRNQWQNFHAYQARLANYPLKPYLDYYYLIKQFNQSGGDKIGSYINAYPQSPMAEKLRRKWLVRLAENQQWQQLINAYQPTKLTKYQCLYFDAMLHTEQQAKIDSEMTERWLTGKTLNENCDNVFTKWLANNPQQKELLWQRFELALKKYNFTLAKSLVTLMSANQAKQAHQVLTLYKNPRLVTKNSYLSGQNSAEVISFGLFRLGRINPNQAAALYKKLDKHYQFNQAQQKRIFQAIALRYALRKDKRSGLWFRKVVGQQLDPVYQEWMIRSALIQRDWDLVKQGIKGMPQQQQQHSRWQYWYARALEQLGEHDKAKAVYAKLAKNRDYHGFLASRKHSDTIKVKHHVPQYSEQDIEQVKQLPGFVRAKLLYNMKQKHQARLELYYLMKHADEKQQYLITKLVSDWGWDTQALHLTRYAEHKDDINLRFPLHYQDSVLKQAKKRKVPPELIYAIIRQESFFIPHAKSPVGAQGLMQLMPATAYRTSKQYKLKYNKKDLLKGVPNIELGSAHLNHLHKQLDNHPILVIAAYNAGKRAVNRWMPKSKKMPADIWVETIPFYETRKYVRHVIAYYVVYQKRLGKEPNIDHIMRAI